MKANVTWTCICSYMVRNGDLENGRNHDDEGESSESNLSFARESAKDNGFCVRIMKKY